MVKNLIRIIILFLLLEGQVFSAELNNGNLIKIEKIRIEASSMIVKAVSTSELKDFPWLTPIEKMEEEFINNEAAVWCGGAAYYLMQKYIQQGYNAYILSIGLEKPIENNPMFTHALVLVELEEKGNKKYIIQDSYLNWGSREDYFDLINKLKLGKLNEINLQINKTNHHKFALIKERLNEKVFERFSIIPESCSKNKNYYICNGNETLEDFFKKYNTPDLKKTLDFIYDNKKHINNHSPLDLLTLPYAVTGKSGYIDINIIKDLKKYDKFKNLDETRLLIKLLDYNK
jgi:hypothetical protein